MLSLIFLLIFGSAIAFLSLQNTMPVTLTFLHYTFKNWPLSYVIIASMLVGIILSYLIHLVESISSTFTIHGKNKKIKEEEKELIEMTKKIHQLQIENARLKNSNDPDSSDIKSL